MPASSPTASVAGPSIPVGSRILLLGCGRMGSALLRGWIEQGIPADTIRVIEPNPTPEVRRMLIEAGVGLDDTPGVPANAAALIMAVKPQTATTAALDVRDLVSAGTLVLSIMAGKPLAELRGLFPTAGSIVRAMPNLAAAVARSATVAIAEPCCPDSFVRLSERLLAGIGALHWLEDESLVDAATAVSGSGPAYAFHLVECLTRAAARLGLDRGISEALARATIEGAGELLRQTGRSAEELRAAVTSPGGTTEAGLRVLLMDDRLQSLIHETVSAAMRRAQDLGRA